MNENWNTMESEILLLQGTWFTSIYNDVLKEISFETCTLWYHAIEVSCLFSLILGDAFNLLYTVPYILSPNSLPTRSLLTLFNLLSWGLLGISWLIVVFLKNSQFYELPYYWKQILANALLEKGNMDSSFGGTQCYKITEPLRALSLVDRCV